MFRILLIVIFFCFSFVNVSKANFDVKARTAILQDYHSGEILYEKEPDISIYPASMTKIMTAIIAFDLIKSGDLNLNEKYQTYLENLEIICPSGCNELSQLKKIKID